MFCTHVGSRNSSFFSTRKWLSRRDQTRLNATLPKRRPEWPHHFEGPVHRALRLSIRQLPARFSSKSDTTLPTVVLTAPRAQVYLF